MRALAALCSYSLPRWLQHDSLHIILTHRSRLSEVIRGYVSRCGTVVHAEKNKFEGRIAKRPPFAARTEFPS